MALENDQEINVKPPGVAIRVITALGSIALLVAMSTDALAVVGRHTGLAFLGAIELFQVAAVVATSSAIVLTTLFDRHAAVHILTEHVSARPRAIIVGIGRLAGGVAFALFCAGSIWVAADLWGTHEMTELLGIPLRWFRLIWIACAGIVALMYFGRLARDLRR
jgi:TRAP-type C4-dicarboxylate transport system permease small subunit